MSQVDPITFEVLSHRLWAINEEGAAALRLISGSPVATEVHDFNTSLLSPEGDAFVVGPYIVAQAVSQQVIVKNILKDYGENPGIGPDDVFITNDPYTGALHQNDVTCVAPIHYNGELMAWAGATIHEVDVGGPVKGSQGSIGSRSIFEEAPVMTPLKIIEGGVIRRDVEREYLMRSRTRELNALDLRAKLASINVAKRRLKELIKRYGPDVLKAVIGGIMDEAEERLRARLRELPDGTYRHRGYIDYFDGVNKAIYPLHLALTRERDRLIFDFTGTAEQAPALLNCSYSGLLAGVLIGILVTLGYDIPWSPGGLLRAVEIIAPPGTIFNATWPAGVSKSTTAGSYAATNLACACISRMLQASEKFKDRSMSLWIGSLPTQELFGTDQRGKPFGVTILDAMAGGAGATRWRDGIDTGGFIRSVAAMIANVETHEFRYPILYLWRRQEADTGGAGRFRGGVGISLAFTPHDVDEIPTNVMHTLGFQQPDSAGMSGGYPGAKNLFAIKRGSNLWGLFSRGTLPQSLKEVDGRLEIPPPLKVSYLKRGDIYQCLASGGGGYGDPLEREPERVLKDVLSGLVSAKSARRLYGVAIDKGVVDEVATKRLREKIRRRRCR